MRGVEKGLCRYRSDKNIIYQRKNSIQPFSEKRGSIDDNNDCRGQHPDHRSSLCRGGANSVDIATLFVSKDTRAIQYLIKQRMGKPNSELIEELCAVFDIVIAALQRQIIPQP
jgi:hypothetical protein